MQEAHTKIEDDGRDTPSRGIYLAYESVQESVSAVQYALPDPTPGFERLVGTDLEPLSEMDPQRVLYNALVPFAAATAEHFLSRSFKVLLEFDPKTCDRLLRLTRNVEIVEAISIAALTQQTLMPGLVPPHPRCMKMWVFSRQRYVIRHRIHVAGFLSPYFLIQFEQFHPGRRGRKSARSRTCRQSRTGDRRKLQPAHQELHHLLELSLHDPPDRGR